MAVAGRVVTGFSKPYVAKYSASAGVVSYTECRKLARGVNVSLEPTSSEDNKFYADNVVAESAGGIFTGGTCSLTVDGLKKDAEEFIMGLPTAGSDGWTEYGEDQQTPYCGFGYITRYVSDGVTTYVPTVLARVMFNQITNSANTQEEEIEYQTQSLTMQLFRGEDDKKNWKYVGKEYATEAEAEEALCAKLGGTSEK